jgi:hypothetical protein
MNSAMHALIIAEAERAARKAAGLPAKSAS